MVKLSRVRLCALLIGWIGLFVSLSSEGFDIVSDPTEEFATAMVIAHQIEEYAQLEAQFKQMVEQNNQLKTANAAMRGQYGFGDWENSESILTHQREWAPDNWKDALKGLSGGNPERYQELLAQYKQAHPAMSEQQYKTATDSHLANAYRNQVASNQASGTLSSYEFERVRKHLQALHALGQQVEDAKKNKNIKAAMDLNSRIQLEVGFIAAEELRMQTVLNQQSAALQAKQIAQQNEAALFNTAGD